RLPAQARRGGQLDQPDGGGVGVIDPAELTPPVAPVAPPRALDDLEIVPMRRRHIRSVLRIEVQSYPKPWTLGLYLSELALGSLGC
ncbi:MAG TPA: hypothetical protein PKA98_07200, partial [Acidimicrobiales bacterium]|nr:hypothetical protein [Acidimicrobiales bacterium]